MDLTEPIKSVGRFLKPYRYFFLVFGIASLLSIIVFNAFPNSLDKMGASVNEAEKVELQSFPIVIPTVKYGFALDTFQVYEGQIQSGDFLGSILQRFHIDNGSINKLVTNSKDIFDVSKFRLDKKYMVLGKDTTQKANYFVYEPDVYKYIIFDLDSLKAKEIKKEIEYNTKVGKGKIESSLWAAMVDNDMSYAVADKMEDALQWSVDFYHVNKGDEFKLLYDEELISGKQVGVNMVKAAVYESNGEKFYSIYFDNGKVAGYYDEYGRPMKSGFLKAPIRSARISSFYNLNRLHPILKRRRPHYGTDYAAKYGTPIMAVGNGVVTKASYTKGNGNYVKIKHDEVYQTQYLHMQKFAAGIRPGVQVKQGQVIGYVGSTGLATGPHVCFRFWKSGKQVNHLKLSFPPPEPLPKENLEAFYKVRDEYLGQLEEKIIPATLEEKKAKEAKQTTT